MPAPVQLFNQADLETAYTAEKVREQLGTKGKPEPDALRVKLTIESATGLVLGQIQRQVKNSSLDYLWENVWQDRDKAEIRRLAISAGGYYMHHYGQKGEEVPESMVMELEHVKERCKEIGDDVATVGAEPIPENSPQHDFQYTTGAGNNPRGSPRSRWRGF